MSNQSGIVGSENLLNQINLLCEDGSSIVCMINDDSTFVEFVEKYETIDSLKHYISENNNPQYILVRVNGQLYFIDYIPDQCHVRHKMLYASTKGTLLRQIGSNNVSKTFMLSDISEIDPRVWNDYYSTSLPLTKSELINKTISEEQNQELVRLRHQLVSQTNGTSHNLNFHIESDSIPKLLTENNFLSFKININQEQVELLNKMTLASENELLEMIEINHPSYSLYKNNKNSLIYFIYSCPSGSKVKERMVYASNKQGFVHYLKDVDNISITKVFEIGDPNELDLSILDNDTFISSPSDQIKQLKFSRPRKPGRKE